MRTPVRPGLVLVLASILAACGGGGGGGGSTGPVVLPVDQWTWIDVPGTACSDGTPTGIAVRPATDHDTMVLLFLDGGGACFGSSSPFACPGGLPGIVTAGPYGEVEFEAEVAAAAGSILDRAVEATPFAGATLVFVPYCTGDVHWGNSSERYGSSVWHHAGRMNLEKDVAWLKENLRAPEKLVVSGASAGGFGTLLAHDLARSAWPGARGYLIDDSGPPLVGGAISDGERQAWYASWGLATTLDPLCGDAGCEADLSRAVAALQAKYPEDRFALLSHLQDATVRAFLENMGASDYQAALTALVDQRFSTATPGAGGAHAFLVDGDGHVLLDDMQAHDAANVPLPDWLGQMVHDDQGWTTLGHP